MTATDGLAVRRPGSAVTPFEPVDRLARWLLVMVALDLLVTRFLLRLAIFVPKDGLLASLAASVGRVAAATDALVALVGWLVLGALLLRAGRSGGPLDRLLLVAVTTVAAGGLAVLLLPATPATTVALAALEVVVAVGAGYRIASVAGVRGLGRLGLLALAGSVGLAAIGRAVDGLAVLIPLVAVELPAAAPIRLAGEVAFVAGAAFVGLAGLRRLVDPRAVAGRRALRLRWPLLAGAATCVGVLVLGSAFPETWGAIIIWSLGLGGAVPTPVVAVAIGLAVAGLPALHPGAGAAVGAAIVVLAGYDLAASGLVLAGLLGLVVAGTRWPEASPSRA